MIEAESDEARGWFARSGRTLGLALVYLLGPAFLTIGLLMVRHNIQIDDLDNWGTYRGRATSMQEGFDNASVSSLKITWTTSRAIPHSDWMPIATETAQRVWERPDKPIQNVYVYGARVCLEEVFAECRDEAKTGWIGHLLVFGVAGIFLVLTTRKFLAWRHRRHDAAR